MNSMHEELKPLNKKELDLIVDGANSHLSKEAGHLTAHLVNSNCPSITAICGSGSRPNLISRIDEMVWREIWEEQAKIYGASYCLNENKAAFNVHLPGTEDYDPIRLKCAELSSLLVRHFFTAISYNRDVAEPYIEQRRRIIQSQSPGLNPLQ